MAGLHFPITGDNSNFISALNQCKSAVRNATTQIKSSGVGIEDIFNRMKSAAAGLGVAFGAREIINDVMRVRGEFQQLEVAFTTMLGSTEKANLVLGQLTQTAAITPFGLQEVAGGAKQLLAFGIEAEKVNETLVSLGDIAAGLSIPLGDLVYLYGTTMTQGRMFTMDLRQFMGRGIPLAEELAEIFGVAKDEVAGLVTEGKVTSDVFARAITNMTSAGSKFGGLMEAQSKTITGQISNIEDAVDVMLNNIGKSSEGIINAGLQSVSFLISNYEKLGEAIAVVVAAYGTYKAAIMINIALNKANSAILAQAVLEKKLSAAASIQLSNAEAIAAAKTKLLAVAQQNLVKSLKAVAAATVANPYVLLGAAVAAAGYAIYKLATYESEEEKANKRLQEAHKNSAVEIERERIEIDKLFRELRKAEEGTDEYNTAKNNILKNYGKYLNGLSDEIQSLNNVEAAYKAITAAAKEAAKERALTSVTAKEADVLAQALAEQKESLYDRLKKIYGDKRGDDGLLLADTYFDDIISQYEELGKLSDEMRGKHLFGEWEGDGQVGQWYKHDAAEIFENMSNIANRQYEEALAKAERLFGKRKSSTSPGRKGTEKETEKQNKAYWEEQKKNAQAELDALTDIEAKSQKGAEIKKRIAEINTKLESYSVKTKKTEPKVDDADEIAKRIEKANQKRIESEKEAYKILIENYGTYYEQKQLLTTEYETAIARANSKGEVNKAKLLQKQYEEALGVLDDKFIDTSNLMVDLFEDASDKTIKEINKVIEKYEKLIQYKKGEVSKDEIISLGFTSEDLKALDDGKINIKDIADALETLKGKASEKSPWQSFFSDMTGSVDKLKNAKGDIGKIGGGISGIGSAVSSFAPAMSEFGSNMSIIFGADDTKIQDITQAIGGLGQSAMGVGQIMAGDVIGGVMSLTQGVAQMVDAFDGMFGADYSEYEALVKQYEGLIDIWDEIISRKKQYVDISYGAEAQKVGQEIIDLTKDEIEAYRTLGKERLNAGASAGSHSIGIRQKNRMDEETRKQLEQASKSIGISYDSIMDGRMTGLFELSAEQLADLREKAPLFWNKLDSDVQEYLENIIACGDEIEDMKDKMNEAMTGVTFDSFYDGFVSTLADMESDSKDFAENFEKYLFNAIISTLVADKYKERIQNLYDKWVGYSDSDGDGKLDLTKEEIENLRHEEDLLVSDMIAEREAIKDAFGFNSSYSQEASSTGFKSMSQNTADELNGRFTALQIAGEDIRAQMISVVTGLNGLLFSMSDKNLTLAQIRDSMLIANGYLENIDINTKSILTKFELQLKAIVDNTNRL